MWTGPDLTLHPIQHSYGRQLLAFKAQNWCSKKRLSQALKPQKLSLNDHPRFLSAISWILQ